MQTIVLDISVSEDGVVVLFNIHGGRYSRRIDVEELFDEISVKRDDGATD